MMTRLSPVLIGIAALALAGCAARETGPVAGLTDTPDLPAQPNIVLVLFEDMSPRVGAFSDPLAHTPNFDQIASEGVRYTRAFTTSGVCAPSRAALITSRYQQSIGAQHMRTTSPAGLPTGGPQNYLAVPEREVKAFPELLRAAGYHTSNANKTDYQFGEPFTIWDENGSDTDWSGHAEGQPFFHMHTLLTSHESAIWPVDMAPGNPVEAFVVARNSEIFAAREARTDPADVTVPPYLPDTPIVRRDIATHYDNIAFTDALLGALYDRLDAEGALDNTILIISTDHGDGLPRMKRSLYDSGLHVPLVVRYPDGWGAGTQTDELVSFVDVGPTILSWAGIEAPEWMHGLDFAGADRDPERTYVFAAQDRMDNEMNWRRAVRDDRFKYIRNQLPGDPYFEPLAFRDSQPTMKALWAGLEDGTLPGPARALFEPLPEDQLYDTHADPHEVKNLAGDPAFKDVLARMESTLDTWLDAYGDMSAVAEVEMINEMWPGGEQPATLAPEMTIEARGAAYHVVLESETPGSSIGYRLDDGDWQLYSAPLRLPAGTTLHAKAVRYGFAESSEVARILD